MDMRVSAGERAHVLLTMNEPNTSLTLISGYVAYGRTAYSSSTQGGIDFGVSSSSSMCSDSKELVVHH
jgi:hypothetical protein